MNIRGGNVEDEYMPSNIIEFGLRRESRVRSSGFRAAESTLDLVLEDQALNSGFCVCAGVPERCMFSAFVFLSVKWR